LVSRIFSKLCVKAETVETPGYLQNTESTKMKESEQIMKENYDEDFNKYTIDDELDEDYDEDFDDYEEDFEEIEFETKSEAERKNQLNLENIKKSKSTTPEEDFARIQRSIKTENKRISSAKQSERIEYQSPVMSTPDSLD